MEMVDAVNRRESPPTMEGFSLEKECVTSSRAQFDRFDLEKEVTHPSSKLLMSAIGCFFVFSIWHASFLMPPSLLLGDSMSTARPCTFVECERGGCDVGTAPFLCVDDTTAEAPYMGCSHVPWSSKTSLCHESCDVSALFFCPLWDDILDMFA